MKYKRLTREQRYQISALRSAGHYQHQIASIVGVHQSTICRELRRHVGARGIYAPLQAHQQAVKHRRAKSQPSITSDTWRQIESLLRQQWSPEQISGRLKLERKSSLSHERIYQYVYADKVKGGCLYTYLRCQKLRRKRYASNQRRIPIVNRTSIELRPPVVAAKKRVGDWEADTIVGRSHQSAIVSVVERKSKLTFLRKVERNTAEAVAQASLSLLRPVSHRVHTITSDNGREFCQHARIAKQLQASFYFAHPYASWERGLNENTNGLVRQYFPKKTDFSLLTDAEVKRVMRMLNHRPRKTLGYRTPHEVFYKQKIYALTS